MSQPRKPGRRPTVTAIIVGTLCFLLSLGIVAGIGFLIFLWAKQMNSTLVVVLKWAGPLPLVIVILWLTLFLMNLFEKATGISLRTRSSRKCV